MKIKNKIEPENCSGIEEIRSEIDTLDNAIISILGKRFNYVMAASKFKSSPSSVSARDRFLSMIDLRRAWAEEEGLNPDVIERMYTDLVNYFIAEEMDKWESESDRS